MEVSINANACDQATWPIAQALHAPFKTIGKNLSKEYGGTMKHLWIDFELIQSHAELRPTFPFRFQKRVSGSGFTKLTGLPAPVRENAGHYGVRPDFQKLVKLPPESVVEYALNLIYASTAVLIDKQKKLGGFDAQRFRLDFLASCKEHGYRIAHTDDVC